MNALADKLKLNGVLSELRKVTWPSKQDTLRLTAIVIVISVIVGVYIGLIDLLLAKGLTLITTKIK